MDEMQNTYRTADFPTICALHYLGFKIEAFDRDPKAAGRIAVCFKRTDDLDATLQSLWSRQLSVEPLAFLETTRVVKARLRDTF